MLKNFWYPLAFSAEVTDTPTRVTVLKQELVLYRTPTGDPICMSDLCIHRGGALSDGWVDQKGCLVCPYHGWEYEQDGACIKIPANRAGVPIPKKARLDAYPSQEKYGFVWAFLGDLPEAERPPLPYWPHFDDIDKYRVLTGMWDWKANYNRVCENGMDAAHAPFVHGSSFGNRDEPEIEDYTVEETEYSAIATVTMKPPPPKGIWGLLQRGKEPKPIVTRVGFFFPCISFLEVNLPFGQLVLYDSNLPVDEFTTLTKWMSLRSFFTGSWADGNARMRVEKIFRQDTPIVEAQRPALVPFDLGAELHVKSDILQLVYRRMRRRVLERGWGIDAHQIADDQRARTYTVIPSPARRNNPELANAWVMKEVPTLTMLVPKDKAVADTTPAAEAVAADLAELTARDNEVAT